MRKTISVLSLAIAVAVLIASQSSAQVTNGSFETGDFTGWGTIDNPAPFFPLQVTTAGANSFGWPWSSAPTDGVFSAYHGWDGAPGTISIFQDVFINGTTLEFDTQAAWDLTFGATIPRFFDVNINVAGGGANLQSTNILTAAPNTTVLDTGLFASAVDVSSFTGSTVQVSFDFTVPESNTGPAAVNLDNIRVTGSVIPEPSSLSLFALDAFALFRRRR